MTFFTNFIETLFQAATAMPASHLSILAILTLALAVVWKEGR